MSRSNRKPEQKLYDNLVAIFVKATDADKATGDAPALGAPMANVIRQFLKDHNISADDDTHPGLKQLKENVGRKPLPFEEAPSSEDAKS